MRWLWSLYCRQRGGILADDMGLGALLRAVNLSQAARPTKLSSPAEPMDGLGVLPCMLVTGLHRPAAPCMQPSLRGMLLAACPAGKTIQCTAFLAGLIESRLIQRAIGEHAFVWLAAGLPRALMRNTSAL